MTMTEALFALIWIAVGGLVGHAIGKARGRPEAGAAWGALLGVIGWLVIAAGPDQRPKCPECGGVVVEGARKCKSCGSDLPAIDALSIDDIDALPEPDLSEDVQRYKPWEASSEGSSSSVDVRVVAFAVVAVLVVGGVYFLTRGPSAGPSAERSAAVTADQPGYASVRATDYGDKWPLTVSEGTLTCRGQDAAAFRRTDGRMYALNGAAQAAGMSPIDPIWKDNPQIPGTKISIGPLIDAALELCR